MVQNPRPETERKERTGEDLSISVESMLLALVAVATDNQESKQPLWKMAETPLETEAGKVEKTIFFFFNQVQAKNVQ